MAALAEKGLKSVYLSKTEKESLLNNMDDIYGIFDFLDQDIPALKSEVISKIMNTIVPKHKNNSHCGILLSIKENIIEILSNLAQWQPNSSVFATRASEPNTISMHKKYGKLTIHMEIVRRDESLVDINVKLADNSKRNHCPFEVELVKSGRCIETINTTQENIVSFFAVEVDDYILKVLNTKKEIASISLRMQE